MSLGWDQVLLLSAPRFCLDENTEFPKFDRFDPFFRPDSPKVMRQTLQLRDCEGGSTLGMESGMEDGDVWGRNRNCQVNQWHTDLGLIGTLGWELMQMDDGSFERPKAGASIVGREMA